MSRLNSNSLIQDVDEVRKYLTMIGLDENRMNVVEDIINAVSSRFDERVGYNLMTQTYAEYADGKGNNMITVKNVPITAITRVAIGRQDAMYIYNSAEYTTAFVSVTSTGITLTKDGVSDFTVTFASYPTIGQIVTAINALGNNWVATLNNTTYTNFQSSELIPRYPSNVIDNNSVWLEVLADAASVYEVHENEGLIFVETSISKGRNNCRVDYTGGYTTTILPDSLKMACLKQAAWEIKKTAEGQNLLGVSYRTQAGGATTYFIDNLLPEVEQTLKHYRRINV